MAEAADPMVRGWYGGGQLVDSYIKLLRIGVLGAVKRAQVHQNAYTLIPVNT